LPIFGAFTFSSPIVFMKPIYIKYQKFFSKFNFNAYLALHMVYLPTYSNYKFNPQVLKMFFHFLGCLPFFEMG
jgi:hypothetical protein